MKKPIFWEEFPGRTKEEVSQTEILSAIQKGLKNGLPGYLSIHDLIDRTSLEIDEEYDYYGGNDMYVPITYIAIVEDIDSPKGWDVIK